MAAVRVTKSGMDHPLEKPEAFKASLDTALNWDQVAFEEWANGSLELAKKIY
jgi:hypothetical protein